MTGSIRHELFAQELLDLLTETFETHHGIYLDKGTSLFETLATISADEASRPVGGKCATLAAQASHVNIYLEVLERYMLHEDEGKVDWGAIWRTVRAVSPEEWARIQSRLRETYQRVLGMMTNKSAWDDGTSVGGAMAIVVHSAYHLGEIRQALCTLR